MTTIVIAIAVMSTACSLVTSLDDLSGGAATVPRADGKETGSDDAAEGDAAKDATDAHRDGDRVTDAGDDAGPNLEPNGTFEGATCDPWIGFQGTVKVVSTAHSGNGACRVCTNPMVSAFDADDVRSPGPDVVGATYHVEAWVRTDPMAPAAPNLHLFLRNATFVSGTFVSYEQSLSPAAGLGATWQRLETTLTFTHEGNVNVFIGADAVAGACFLFDDVVLRRMN